MTTEQSTPQEMTQDTEEVQLQVTDLVKVLEILNVVSARGAIKPDEFSTVGGIYERLYQFLVYSKVIKPSGSDTDAAESDETAETSA
jgi:hypothetical protein